MLDKPKNIVKVPEVTPELVAENQEMQNRWRGLYRARSVSAEAYGEMVLVSNLKILDSLELQLKRAERGAKQPIKDKIRAIRRDLAAQMAALGKFTAAMRLAPTRQQGENYRAFRRAERIKDDLWCEHPSFIYVDGQKQQQAYREFDFYSEIFGRRVSMVRCNVCGFRNAKDLDSELKKLSDFRAAVVAAAKDVPRSQVARQLQSLNLLSDDLEAITK